MRGPPAPGTTTGSHAPAATPVTRPRNRQPDLHSRGYREGLIGCTRSAGQCQPLQHAERQGDAVVLFAAERELTDLGDGVTGDRPRVGRPSA